MKKAQRATTRWLAAVVRNFGFIRQVSRPGNFGAAAADCQAALARPRVPAIPRTSRPAHRDPRGIAAGEAEPPRPPRASPPPPCGAALRAPAPPRVPARGDWDPSVQG